MTRILKTRIFSQWMRKTTLTDEALRKAVEEMAAGLIDADLGGGLFKKRVPLQGKGKSGGARTLVATNRNDRWIFVFGFEKNERDNIDKPELAALRNLAQDLLEYTDSALDKAIKDKALQEMPNEPDN